MPLREAERSPHPSRRAERRLQGFPRPPKGKAKQVGGGRPPSPRFCREKATHLKVDGIHAEFLGVQVAELGKGSRHIVQVVDGFGHRVDHFLAVSLEIAGAGAQVEVVEVGLGGWVSGEHPAGEKKGE